jgi:hypothetical protein
MKKRLLFSFFFLLSLSRLFSDGPVRIDILVLHTPAVTAHYQGVEGITAHILATMDSANAALENSGIDMIWHLVGIEEIEYDESSTDLYDDLDNLTDGLNGFEGVSDLRDAYGADLVSLFRRGAAGGFAGLAWRLNANSPNQHFGFNVVSDESALNGFTFAHEVGHNLSSVHHRQDPNVGTPQLNTSYGYIFTGSDDNDYRTIMATDQNFAKIPHFSNPLVTFAGVPTGIADPSPDAADNAASFAIVGPAIETFRPAQPAIPDVWFEPRGTTVVSGRAAFLSPQVNGLPPLTLEWFEGESGNQAQPVMGATDRMLTLDPVTETLSYWLRVSNPEGTAETRSVRVVAVPPPVGPFSQMINQDQIRVGYSVVGQTWQEMVFPSGYVASITVDLFKDLNGNGTDYPVVKMVLLRKSTQVIFQTLIDPGGVTQFLTPVTVPVQTFVVPGETYRLSLAVHSGGTDGGIFWAGKEGMIDPAAGIGNSSIHASNNDDWAFAFRADGTEATTFHKWAAAESISAEEGEPSDILDGDKVPNLIRYAMGGSASDEGVTLLPALQEVLEINEERFLPYRFTKRRHMADVDLRVELSTDLETWTPFSPSNVVHLNEFDTPTTRTFEARLPIAEQDKAFLRVNALYPPEN